MGANKGADMGENWGVNFIRRAGLLGVGWLSVLGLAFGDDAAAPGGGLASKGNSAPTFTRDIAPIFYAHCTTCHRPGQIAPMSLLSYEDTRPWVKSISKNVATRAMPPWPSNPEIGHFKEINVLSKEEIERVISWADAGAPMGEPADLPAAPKYPEGWALGEPDKLIEFEPFAIAADAPADNVFELPALTATDEDRFVTAIEVRCEPQDIVHHVILYVQDDRKRVSSPINWLVGWGPGSPPLVLTEGTGRLLKKDAKIIANIHLTPRGTGGETRIKVGLHFAPKEEKLAEVENKWVMNPTFVIPPGEPYYEVVANWRLPFDADLHRIFPHMHYRGRDMTMTAHFPDGSSKVLIETAWDNDWQLSYSLVEPLRMPKGTRFEVLGHYDNSAGNPVNPDPKQEVKWAIDVSGEMFVGMIDYVRVADAQ